MKKQPATEYKLKLAEISVCGKYRYSLTRVWDHMKPTVLWIMHNPSTADENQDDPTIRRIVQFSKDWGYGGIMVGNLFAYRATYPSDLKGIEQSELIGPRNYEFIKRMSLRCDLHVLAYGNPVAEPPKFLTELMDVQWRALKLTAGGNPCHPLYLRSELRARKMDILRQELKELHAEYYEKNPHMK